jgi:hypothetical protein
MRARGALIATVAVVLVACTSGQTTTSSQSPSPSAAASTSSTPAAPETMLADGSALPDGCRGRTVTSQTLGFVAQGRAWALDPGAGGLSCLFTVADPGSFSFGPQGDRVVLADLRVRAVDAAAPHWPASAAETPEVFDWGHPIGLAIVYADATGRPAKRFMDDGSTEALPDLPKGDYQAIAYHPSGLALGFIVDTGDRQGIWISSNEGTDPERLVFSRSDTVFSSLAFSPDGTKLWWIAQHAGAISEIHWMDLADRSGFSTVLSRGLAPTAHGLLLAPAGPLIAATQGTGCADTKAMIVDDDGAHPAIPGAGQPTGAVGWLDATTLLVASGDCDQPVTLFAVGPHGEHATMLVDGVDIGAVRTVLRDAPTEVPAPPQEASPAPPGGVG